MKLLELFKELSLHPKNVEELTGLILQLAVQGKLTVKWREQHSDVAPAKILLNKIHDEKARLIRKKKIKNENPLPIVTVDEIPYELPNGWIWCRLGNISTLINGDRGKNYPSKEHYVESGVPFVTAGNLGERFLKHDDLNYITEDRYALLRSGLINKNDILYCLRGSLGKCAIIEGIEKGAIASSLCIVRTIMGIDYDYLLNYFLSPLGKEMILRHDNGTAQPNLSATDVRKYVFPLPPFEEQQAIVEIVNQLFTEVDQLESLTKERIQLKEDFATSALQRLTQADNTAEEWAYLQQQFPVFFTEKANIKKFRETILQLAIQGKLTGKWREKHMDVEPASVLMEKVLTEKARLIKEKKIKKEQSLEDVEDDSIETLPLWACVRFGNIGDWGAGATPLRSRPDFYGGDINWFKSGELNNGIIDYSSEEKITDLALQKVSLRLNQPGDVLMAMYGATIGKTGLLAVPGTTNQAVCACTPFSCITSEYLLLLLKAFKEVFISQGEGGAQPNISRVKIRNQVFCLPPLEEQKAIVEKVNALMALCDELEQQIEAGHTQIEQLMQSCLREVFAN